MLEEQQHRIADGVGGGRITACDELVHQVLEFVHRERLVAVGRVGKEGREDVVGRVGAPLLEQGGQVVLGLGLHLGVVLCGRLIDEEAHGRSQHAVAPALEGTDRIGVQADLLGDDKARQGKGEGVDEVALALVDEGIDEVVGDAGDAGQHRLDHARRQRAVDEPAVAAMHRRIGALEGLHMAPAHLGQVIVEHAPEIGRSLACQLLDHDVVRERGRIGQHGFQIVIGRDDEEPGLGHPIDGCTLAQLGVITEWARLYFGFEQASLDLGSRHCSTRLCGVHGSKHAHSRMSASCGKFVYTTSLGRRGRLDRRTGT
ncbi:unannotated protein [freshwater metagenome]|uniref:Unannotated protein n=1 Tax=freshwater metagenome TaxID=449393 RepID=A0A6J7I6P4_9ZZZZ